MSGQVEPPVIGIGLQPMGPGCAMTCGAPWVCQHCNVHVPAMERHACPVPEDSADGDPA